MARRFNVSRQTVHAWLRASDAGLGGGGAALKLPAAGSATEAEQISALAAAARARADQARTLSDIYADPAFTPATPDGFPDLQAYFEGRAAVERVMVAQQNAASDSYNDWNSRRSPSGCGCSLPHRPVAFSCW